MPVTVPADSERWLWDDCGYRASWAGGVRIEEVELRRVLLPLVTPFRTAFGTETAREALLVRVVTAEGDGWGECVAMSEPLYSSEHVDGAEDVSWRWLLPLLLQADGVDAASVASVLAPVKGHRMAKAALEMAVLDAQLTVAGVSLATHLGATRSVVDCGVSVGIPPSLDALLEVVAGHLDEGYRRIKLKVEPGWDVEPVRAVRERFGDTVMMQVDANGSYGRRDLARLAALDPFDLALIEQPFADDDFEGHALLAREISTPICLDESIGSLGEARRALDAGACSVVNIKPGRVGGLLEAVRIHDLCVARNVAVWCGGMLETGLGRAANVALAALPGFTLPGDISASDRYFDRDITEPFVLRDGRLDVPTAPGVGVRPIPGILEDVTKSSRTMRRHEAAG